jgi:hypothetical protein
LCHEEYDLLGCNTTAVSDVSEEYITSIFMIEEYANQETSKNKQQAELCQTFWTSVLPTSSEQKPSKEPVWSRSKQRFAQRLVGICHMHPLDRKVFFLVG